MMKKKKLFILRKGKTNRNRSESGNIFFMLFASVALVGAFAASTSTTLKGIVTTMSDTTRKTIAEEKMMGGARLSVQNATLLQANTGDCDSDGMVEPMPFVTATGPHPTGGGYLPADIGITEKDPWGTPYGYCSWDPGTVQAHAGCGGAGANRLAGTNSADSTVVAVISAGKDRIFSSSCVVGIPADCSGLGDDYYNDPVSGHCYYLETSPASWDDAQTACASNGGYLVAVTSATEQAIMDAQFTMAGGIWIGADDKAEEGEWQYSFGEMAGVRFWSGTQAGGPVGGRYNNWISGFEPDGGSSQNCAAFGFGHGGWGDDDCPNARQYICEVPNGGPSVIRQDGSDDLVIEYTYRDASGMGDEDLWKVKDTAPNTMSIDKNIEVTGGATFDGAINLMEKGLILPTDPGDGSVTGLCDASTDQQLRINGGASPPSLEICDFTGGKGWVAISMGDNGSGGMPAGYLAWFKFDEGTGSASTQDEVGPYTGTMSGFNTATDWVAGKNGSALRFNGTSTRINFGSPAALDNLSRYSICMWVQPDLDSSGDVAARLVTKSTGLANALGDEVSIYMWPDPPYGLGASTRAGPWTLYEGEFMPSAGTWAHLCAVWNGGTNQSDIKFYVNGIAVTKAPSGGASANDPNDDAVHSWYIGDWATAAPDRNFKGLMDDVVIYGRDLSASEVKGLYVAQGGEPALSDSFSPPPGLVGWWRFDEMGGSVARDSSSSKNNGTLTGPVSFVPGRYGRAAYFSGDGSYITMGSPASLDDISPYSICLWANVPATFPHGPGTWGTVVDKSNVSTGPGTSGSSLALHQSGGVGMLADGSYNQKLSAYSNNEWHLLCTTWTGGTTASTIKLYVDGVEQTSFDNTGNGGGNQVDAAFSFIIGNNNAFDSAFTGYLDEVMIFNRVLTGSEVMSIYNRTVLIGGTGVLTAKLRDTTTSTCPSPGQGPGLKSSQTNANVDVAFWSSGAYTYAVGDSALHALFVNNDGTFTRTTAAGDLGSQPFNDVWGDSSYIYAVSDDDLYAATFDGTTFTKVAETATGGGAVWADGIYIYVADGAVLNAFRFDGSSFTTAGTLTTTAGPINDIWGDGSYLYVSGNNRFAVYSYNGSQFTEVNGVNRNTLKSYGDGSYLYAVNGTNVDAYSFNGSILTLLATLPMDVNGARTISGIGKDIFVGGTTTSFKTYSFNGTRFVPRSVTNTAGATAFWTQGGYLYVGTATGLEVYTGFECGRRSPAPAVVLAANDLAYKVSSGEHSSCAIKSDGSLWCWGRDTNGRLGNGADLTADQQTMTRVVSNASWTQVSVSNSAACGIQTDGSAWCWGSDADNQLGNGAVLIGDQPTPTVVAGGGLWAQISAGDNFACAIHRDGSAWCWGSDSQGQLGNDGTAGSQHSPSAVSEPGPWVQISAGLDFACGIKSMGSLWCWGNNGSGQLGIGTAVGTQIAPVLVAEAGPWVHVSAGSGYACAVKLDGTAWCWGSNTNGEIGIGQIGPTINMLPMRVIDPGPWLRIAASPTSKATLGLKQDGTLWGWGQNTSFRLALPSSGANYSTPTRLLDPGPWASMAMGGSFACAMKTDGGPWCWGADGSDGYVGNGTVTTSTVEEPEAVLYFAMPEAFQWNNTGTELTGSTGTGTRHFVVEDTSAIGYDGWYTTDLIPSGLTFSGATTSILRQNPGNMQLLIETTDNASSPDLTWSAQSIAAGRSIGVDYATKNLELGLNDATNSLPMHSIGTTLLDIAPNGFVGVNDVDAPVSRLHINGSLRVGMDNGDCVPSRKGTLRFTGNEFAFEYCTGSAWIAF